MEENTNAIQNANMAKYGDLIEMAFEQVSHDGVLTETVLSTFTQSGWPLISAISSIYPIPLDRVKDRVSEGMVTAAMLKNVLHKLVAR